MESKKQTTPTPPPPATAATAAAARGDYKTNTTKARAADLCLLRDLCVHVLQPLVAKAQAILRDAAPHLEALEREEGDEDAANARENTADADALAMLPGFFTALERAGAATVASAANPVPVFPEGARPSGFEFVSLSFPPHCAAIAPSRCAP